MFYEIAFEHRETGEIVGIDLILDCEFEVRSIDSTDTESEFYYDLIEFWQEQCVSDDDIVLFMELYGFDYVGHKETEYDF